MPNFDIHKLRQEFLERSERQHERHKQYGMRQQKEHREKLAEEAEVAEADFLALGQAAIEATAEAITLFENDLSKYEALTVEEIMRLQGHLDALLAEREALLANTHVLPDGRRVFKTLDGQRVFDEHGIEVGQDIIHPDMIGDDKTRHETFLQNGSAIERTRRSLDAMHEFKDELDGIRDELGNKQITDEKLEELREQLESAAPVEIRLRKIEMDGGVMPPKATSKFTAATASNKINLDTLNIGAPELGS